MRAYSPPPWLPMDPDPPGRAAVVEHICVLLAEPWAMVSLVAEPGSGATTVTGAVATRMTRRLPVCAVRLAGFTTLPQLFHAVGHALGSPFPRDQAAVCEALREAGPTLLVLDDADQEGTATVVERLAAVAPEARFMAVGRTAVLDERVVRVPPLLDTEGSQLDPALPLSDAARLASANLVLRHLDPSLRGDIDAEDPWAFLDALPDSVDLLAAFPAGIPGGRPQDIPLALMLPSGPSRCVLRRCVAEALVERRGRSEHDLAMALLTRCGKLLRVAEQPSRAIPPLPADLVAVRFLAEHHPDPGEAARASAAWSRFLVVAGQASAARVWQNADTRIPRGSRFEALIAWAEGDATLADGDIDAAHVAYEFAATQLRRDGDARLLAGLHLRCADLLLARGVLGAAKEHAQAASELFDGLNDPLGLALCRRALAGASMATGDTTEAGALLDQARLSLGAPGGDPPLPCSLYLAYGALELLRGEPDQAGAWLRRAREAVDTNPQLRGVLDRLRAEVAVRRDDLDEAERRLDQAAASFGETGDRTALGVAMRLLGDVAALAGRPRQANEHYQRATREQVRAGDMTGLARTMEHRAALERELGSDAVADELDQLRRELLSLPPPG